MTFLSALSQWVQWFAWADNRDPQSVWAAVVWKMAR